ncbi:MAG: DUF4168 domain-containing protein [Methylacidiphilales bacterium]|nr:DUF4168 domain-containing protein [Candidatus Methylacidiphilales bacterium]NJR15578.1 DUF4168 domain-containing protein [Calothrix sp. CSU_2_0]
MLKFHYSFLPFKFSQMLGHPIVMGSLTAASLLVGTTMFGSKAYAQNQLPNAAEIVNYAKAVLAMESPRQQALEEIKKIIGNTEVPKIICNDANSFNALPGKAKDIAVRYCKDSQEIVQKSGFRDVNRFNEITVELQGNEGLQKKIYEQLIILQKKPGS